MSKKIVDNIDEEQWRIFAGLCKIKNKIVGEELSKVIKEYNERNIDLNKK